MRREKFKRGDLVRIAVDLGPAMAHFSGKGSRAIVCGSYRELYGGTGEGGHTYSLFVEDAGRSSWYDEDQLIFIEHNPELLWSWESRQAEVNAYADKLERLLNACSEIRCYVEGEGTEDEIKRFKHAIAFAMGGAA